MPTDILDDQWQEAYDGDIVVVKYFYQESEAELYAIELRAAGIRTFVANGPSQSMLPVGPGWIGLHVRQEDLPTALTIVEALDHANGQTSTPTNEWRWVIGTLVVVLLLILLRVAVWLLMGV